MFREERTRPEVMVSLPTIAAQEHERWLQALWVGPQNRDHLYTCSRTLFHDDQPICIVGCSPMWKGVAEIWSLLTPAVYAHPIITMRFQLRWMEYARELFWLERMHAYVNEQVPLAFKWLKRVGFVDETPEGLHRWMDGKTYHLLAKTWGG